MYDDIAVDRRLSSTFPIKVSKSLPNSDEVFLLKSESESETVYLKFN